jgi:DUF1365 family protein
MESAIYHCEVMHQRLVPLRHGFQYPVFYLWLDLDEVKALDRGLMWLSRNRWNLFAFFDRDHLGGAVTDLKSGVLERMRQDGMDVKGVERVRMLCFPRVLGYVFNPVVFYFAFDDGGRAVGALVQVTNTFHEQKLYSVPLDGEGGGLRRVVTKAFYVSPFSKLDLCFDFQLAVPDEGLEIRVDDVTAAGEKVLLSRLWGRRVELTDGQLLSCAVTYPFLTLRVMALIHWHALRLWMKRLPFFRKAADPEMQTDVLRPHKSLNTKSI